MVTINKKDVPQIKVLPVLPSFLEYFRLPFLMDPMIKNKEENNNEKN